MNRELQQQQPNVQRMFILNVVSMMGFKYVFNVCTDEFTIPNLKQLINHYLGIPVDAFKIVKDSTVLKAGSLRDYNIRDGASVQIVPQARSGLLGFSTSSSTSFPRAQLLHQQQQQQQQFNNQNNIFSSSSSSSNNNNNNNSQQQQQHSSTIPQLSHQPSTSAMSASSTPSLSSGASSCSDSDVASDMYSSASPSPAPSLPTSVSPQPPQLPEDLDDVSSLSSEMYRVFYPQSTTAPSGAEARSATGATTTTATTTTTTTTTTHHHHHHHTAAFATNFNFVTMNEDAFEESSSYGTSGDTILTSSAAPSAGRSLVPFPADMSTQVTTATRTITHTTHMRSCIPAAVMPMAVPAPTTSAAVVPMCLHAPSSPVNTPDVPVAPEGGSAIQKLVAKIRSTKKSLFDLSRPLSASQPMKKHLSAPKHIPTKPSPAF